MLANKKKNAKIVTKGIKKKKRSKDSRLHFNYNTKEEKRGNSNLREKL